MMKVIHILIKDYLECSVVDLYTVSSDTRASFLSVGYPDAAQLPSIYYLPFSLVLS